MTAARILVCSFVALGGHNAIGDHRLVSAHSGCTLHNISAIMLRRRMPVGFHCALSSKRLQDTIERQGMAVHPPKILGVVNYCLAIFVGLFGIAIALTTLERGPWLDEFLTIAWTTNTSPREFLYLVTIVEYQPILHFGLIFLAQHAGITDVALLRALNILGLPLVLLALRYARRQRAINVPQALVLWVLYTSSPIFFEYFAELRSYFLLYSASIALSIIWYVLMKHIEENRYLSWFMIATWAAYLMIFANLHYFGTCSVGF